MTDPDNEPTFRGWWRGRIVYPECHCRHASDCSGAPQCPSWSRSKEDDCPPGPLSNDPAIRARQLRWSAANMRELAATTTEEGRAFRLHLAQGLEEEAALLDRGLHTISTGGGGTRVVPFTAEEPA